MSAFRIETSVAQTLNHLVAARSDPQAQAGAAETPAPKAPTLWEDTLQISKAALTAQKEYPESPIHEASESLTETIAEAGGGDPLAQRDAGRQVAGGGTVHPSGYPKEQSPFGGLWE